MLQLLNNKKIINKFQAYDRTGEGLAMDGSFFDKYGAPITLKDHWMDGYDKHGVFYVDLLLGNDLNVTGIMLWTGC